MNRLEERWVADENQTIAQFDNVNSTTTSYESAAIDNLNKSYADILFPVSVTWGIIALLGCLGNAAVILMFSTDRRLKRRPLRLHSISLAVVDLFSSIFIIPFEIYKHRNYFSAETNAMCKYKCFFNIMTMACTCFLLVFIAVNRYLVSTRPLSVYQQEQQKKGHITLKICCGFLLSVLISVPLPILCGSYSTRIQDLHGQEMYTHVCGPEQKYRFSVFRFIYKYFLSGLQLILSIVLVVLYCLIARKIRRDWRGRVRGSVAFLPSDTRDIAMETDSLNNAREIMQNATTPVPRNTRNKPRGSVVHVAIPNRNPTRQLQRNNSAGWLSLNIKVMLGVTIIFVTTYLIYAGLSFIDTADIHVKYFAIYAFAYRIYFVNCLAMPVLYLKFDMKFRACFVSYMRNERRGPISSVNGSSKRRLTSVSTL